MDVVMAIIEIYIFFTFSDSKETMLSFVCYSRNATQQTLFAVDAVNHREVLLSVKHMLYVKPQTVNCVYLSCHLCCTFKIHFVNTFFASLGTETTI